MQQQAAALARQYALIGAGSGSSFDGARAAGRLSAFDFMP
jgi:glycerol dehydrogenase-like iron-containing ADH family enzyme